MAVAVGSAACLAGWTRKDWKLVSLGLLFACGSATAVLSSVPARRQSRAELAHANDEVNATLLGAARLRAARSIESVFGRDAPMAKALLIADQHEISPEMRDRYARAGIIHMLSISGLHVAIIASAVLLLLQLARMPSAHAAAGSLLIIGIYVAIIGAPAPAVRAAVMVGVATASRLWQRPTSPWAAWAIGAFVPLVSPRTVLDLGYQLSVAGIAGLIASGALSRRLPLFNSSALGRRLSRELITSAVASVVSAPLVMWYFGRMSIVAPVANLVTGPVITILQPALFLALIFSPLPALARFVAGAVHPLMWIFDGIATAASSIPGSSLQVTPSLVAVSAAAIAIIAFIVASVSRYPGRPIVIGAAALTLTAWSPSVHLPYGGEVELHVLDVGQGDAILLRSDKGRWILFDAGRKWKTGDAGRTTIIPYVMRRGGELDAFILSHAHLDHIGGASTVFSALHPSRFYDAAFAQGSAVYDQALRNAKAENVQWLRVHPGDAFRLDGVEVDFLAPDSAWTASLSDPNSASTIALVRFGAVRFLLVGDAEAPEEAWLLDHARSELHADVLKVGHHGSSTSSTDAFLEAVHPSTAIISVGIDNIYGHPSADVVAALGRIGARVVRTDRVGTIIVRTNGTRITMEADGRRWDISPVSPGL